MPNGNKDRTQRNPGVFDNLSNKGPSHRFTRAPPPTHLYTKSKSTHFGGPRINPQRKGRCTKPPYPSDSSNHNIHTPIPLKHSKKREHKLYIEPPPPPTPPEDCIGHLPAGVSFPKKPAGCKVIPQTIEPGPKDRSTVYFTRNGVLGMPLRYMYNLDDMDDANEPADLGLDPTKSCHIDLIIAWPGYKEATYQIIVFTPLYPTAPFVTIYGLRQLTKHELAIEILRCVHQWMIEHPWSGECHEGIPEWKLSGENSPGVSAKAVWLAMISPVGDGRWVTQLQKAPGP